MDEKTQKELLKFADELHKTAELIETTVNRVYGRKSVGQRARVALNDIKKQITHIKRLTMEID